MKKYLVLPLTFPMLLSLPAMAQPPADNAICPTRFFDRLNKNPGYIRVPGVEEATTLAPGALLLDTAIGPSVGLSYGLNPNLEIGMIVTGSTQFKVISGKFQGQELTNAGLGFQGKYHLLSGGSWQLGFLGEAGYGYQSMSQIGVKYTNDWLGYIGLPLSFYPQEWYSLHAMPIVEIGSYGELPTASGISAGAKIRLNPILWLLVGDYLGIGGGFSQTFTSGIRYQPASWGAFDIKLVDNISNTGTPGFRIGFLGVNTYFR